MERAWLLDDLKPWPVARKALGLVLSLNLLGVSREYELQADQLGVQYTWNAGYDPTGFIRFFDKRHEKTGHKFRARFE